MMAHKIRAAKDASASPAEPEAEPLSSTWDRDGVPAASISPVSACAGAKGINMAPVSSTPATALRMTRFNSDLLTLNTFGPQARTTRVRSTDTHPSLRTARRPVVPPSRIPDLSPWPGTWGGRLATGVISSTNRDRRRLRSRRGCAPCGSSRSNLCKRCAVGEDGDPIGVSLGRLERTGRRRWSCRARASRRPHRTGGAAGPLGC
jgi:hypothetical protein